MPIEIFEQKDFTGGLNLRSDQFQLKDNESPEMLNVEVDPRGGVFSRGGMSRLPATTIAGTWSPHRLIPFYSATSRLMLVNNAKIFLYTGSAWTALTHSGGDITGTAEDGIAAASWGKTLYMVTGQGGAGGYKWDGLDTVGVPSVCTTLTPSGTAPDAWQITADDTKLKMPKANFIVAHANRMFVAGTNEGGVDFPNRIRWSYEDIPNNWKFEDSIDIEGGGNRITGICVVNGGLVVFKDYAIYYIMGYDSTDFRVVQISTDTGCGGSDAFVAASEGVFFYANRKGLHFFDGSNIENIFEPLRPAFDLGYINTNVTNKISLSWLGRRLWMSVPYSVVDVVTTETLNIVYDPSMGSYTMFSTSDGYGVRGGTDFRDNNNEEQRLACHPVIQSVVQVDKYKQNYDAIKVNGDIDGYVTTYRTKWFDAGSFLQRKMFRRPDLVMRETETTQSVNVKVYHDYQESAGSQKREFNLDLTSTAVGMLWGENWTLEGVGQNIYASVWSGSTLGGTIKTAQNLGLARTVQLNFTGEMKKPWGINSIGYKWVPRRVKG
ncbi:hypothetical protein UFOVP923_5 [uncultured Caudovirales phage]|uniref:Uncharacterized protein n=1 Tax=uncultured Caudovirales phage TaxID=2100421 RepID=A0A6J5PNJ8_9CAUD|nr:hypothetical protein UFOVP923_5 [uncultured Caudovirales phage]